MSLTPAFVTETDGNGAKRGICDHCGFVDYHNPRIVVGSVVRFGDLYLMCRRAIEPQRGLWTLPAGYLELGETPEAGAVREALEEANATIRVDSLLAIYSVPRLSQVEIMHRARLIAPKIAPGPESLEVRLFSWDDLPFGEIAFASVSAALHDDRESTLNGRREPFLREI